MVADHKLNGLGQLKFITYSSVSQTYGTGLSGLKSKCELHSFWMLQERIFSFLASGPLPPSSKSWPGPSHLVSLWPSLWFPLTCLRTLVIITLTLPGWSRIISPSQGPWLYYVYRELKCKVKYSQFRELGCEHFWTALLYLSQLVLDFSQVFLSVLQPGSI